MKIATKVVARSSDSRLDSGLVAAAGEHYVLSQLFLKGMVAALAPRNFRDVDIIVLADSERVIAGLQVKSRTIGGDGGWHMKKKHESLVRASLFYAFVDFEPLQPAVFVVPSATVAKVVTDAHAIWLKTPGKKGQQRNDTEMRRVLPRYKDAVPGFDHGWLDAYRDRWDQLPVG